MASALAIEGRSDQRIKHRWASLLFIAGVCTGFQAAAQPVRRDGPRSEAEWIQAARNAAQKVNYVGTIVYQSGGEITSSRITHVFDGERSHERIQTLDGKPREYLRYRSDRDDEVQCLIPESKKILIEKRSVEETFPSLTNASPDEILQRYEARLGPVERVAGLDAQSLALEPRDSWRYAYRLWLERLSGLLLRAQTLNERRDVIEQISFSEVKIGERIDRSALKPAWSVEGWSIVKSNYKQADLAKQGWNVPVPEGFRKTKEVSRRIGGKDALQAVFTDGLATVSVFIVPGSQAGEPEPAVRMNGPTSVFSRRLADALVTVVGEVPPGTVRAVAQSVEFRGAR